MGQGNFGNIILTGFSYTGKSAVAREVARRLGWSFVDTDDEIVSLAGKTIPEIFSQDGEQSFRELERRVLQSACERKDVVIATGGGAVVDADNRELMRKSGVVICLEAQPDTIYRRLLADAEKGETVVRPLLAMPDPKQHITKLKELRQPYYALSDWSVHTDNLTIDEVCQEVVRGWEYGRRRISSPAPQMQEAACIVATAAESYPIFIGWNLLPELGRKMQNIGLSGNVYLISDDGVFPLFGAQVADSLQQVGFAVNSFVVPQGEKSKSIEVAVEIYDWLVDRYAERGHVIAALGGGMVGDLAGFVAATFLRGMPLVQVPTSLVAMVDSSIGGKVAVDHPQGKNLIGAFYQPRLVLSDLRTLKTLPPRELVSGWAEVIKHAMILDPDLLQLLQAHSEELLHLEPELTAEAIRRSASIKAKVVSEDEREAGLRTILNYGHTIGHGLEAATGYERLLHGEAVAVGMMGAAMISQRLGLLPQEVVEQQRAILQNFGLPTGYRDIDIKSILQAMELDKKVRERAVRWVLLKDVGQAIIRADVPHEVVLSVLAELLQQ
jgi:shikimate kinase/3-dehydroquinate synthase